MEQMVTELRPNRRSRRQRALTSNAWVGAVVFTLVAGGAILLMLGP